LTDVLALPAVVLSVAGFLGGLHWLIDLTAHFRLQYALGLTLLALLAAVRRRWVRLAVLLAAVGVNGWLVASLWLPPAASPAPASSAQTTAPPLSLVVANVSTQNPHKREALDAIAGQNTDVVLLMEVSPEWFEVIPRHLPGYRTVVARAQWDNFGMALMVADDSPWACEGTTQWMPPDQLPAADAVLTHGNGERWRLLGLHPVPPMSARMSASRNETLATAAAWTRNHPDDPKLLAGDLNATPWCTAFRELMADTGLTNSMQGHGLAPSWPSLDALPYAISAVGMIPIDHVLHSPSIRTSKRQTFSIPGSDHRGVRVELQRVSVPSDDQKPAR
ncbi:MAG: endonuclease/exonuclease/phosphatase family protein, partial [Phycisphaeraceae bacterium]